MTRADVSALVAEIGPVLAERAAEHDREASFVHENYELLKKKRVFSAGVPLELGGGGASHRELCVLLSDLASHCGSTALALSMHTHLLAAAVYRFKRKQPGEQLLRKVAAEQAVLVSTGAADWLASNGRMEAVDGGYRLSGRKVFASGCPQGDLLITSAPNDAAASGPAVLHFPVPLKAEGVRLLNDWDTLGMRGTGSHTVVLENVFVPSSAIVLERPKGVWHPMWNVVLTVAVPIYMAPYVGVARAAAAIARRECRSARASEPTTAYVLGEMENALVAAELAHESMIAVTNDYDFEPVVENANAQAIRKTLVANSVREVVRKAMEAVGGASLFRRLGLERLLRDVEGAQFHPLQEKRQLAFTGRLALGLDPIA